MGEKLDWMEGIGDFEVKKVNKATKRSAGAGTYERKTILLKPSMIDFIKQVAGVEGLPLMETYRWLLDAGIEEYESGRLAVEDRGEVIVRKRRAVMREWE